MKKVIFLGFIFILASQVKANVAKVYLESKPLSEVVYEDKDFKTY